MLLFFYGNYLYLFVTKQIRLQHRTFLDAGHTTKYIQHRINLPDEIIKKIGWEKNLISISVESRDGKKRMVLKIKD